jgi:hypothetical protein
LPSENILPNILERDHSVFEDAARKASQIFLGNIDELSLKNQHNELVLSAIINNDVVVEKDEVVAEQFKSKEEAAEKESLRFDEASLKIEIPVSNGKKVIIYYPTDLSINDVVLLKLQINVLEHYVNNK